MFLNNKFEFKKPFENKIWVFYNDHSLYSTVICEYGVKHTLCNMW